LRLGLGSEERGGQPPAIGFIWGIWPPPNKRGAYEGAMPPGRKLGFSLSVGIEYEICDVMLVIQKENGLETEGID
jgi:hypothetical protein